MHELGVVFYIIDDVKKVAIENKVDLVKNVVLDLGEVTTVIPSYLEDCWNWAVNKESLLKGCKLTINKIKAITFCEDCKGTYDTVQYGKVCPHCQSEHTYLLTGNEIEIRHIEV